MKKYYSLIVGELLPFVGFFGAVFALGLITADFPENMVLPGGDLASSLAIRMFVGGVVLGVVILGWDESRGSLDYVRHRGMSYLRQQYAHHAASATVLLGVHFIGTALWLGYHAFSDAAAIADWSRVLTLGVTSAAGLTGYALGFWIAALPWNAVGRTTFGLLASLAMATFLKDQVELSVTGETGDPLAFLGINLALTAGLLVAGHHALSLTRDPDHPLPTRGALTQGLLVALVLSAVAGGAAREIQEGRLMALASRYPSVGSVPDEGVRKDARKRLMLANHVVGEDGMVPVDDERQRLDSELDQTGLVFHFMPWRHWIRCRDGDFEALSLDNRRVLHESFPFEGPYEEAVDHKGWLGWLDRGDAQVELVHLGRGAEPARMQLAPEGGFSPTARVLRPGDDGMPAIFLDRGVAYCLDAAGTPVLRRVDLGEGRITGFAVDRDSVLLETDGGTWEIAEEGDAALLVGAEKQTADRRIKREEEKRLQEEHLARTIPDPIEFEVTTRIGERDEVVVYRPTTRSEKVAAWVMRSATLLRPPVLVALSHAGDLSEKPWARWTFERAWFVDPLVAGGKRSGWVVASFLVAAFLGGIQWWVLRRCGVPAGRTRAWVGLTLLLGPSGFLVGLLVDSEVAWRWVGAEFEEAEEPRVFSSVG